MRKIYDVSIVGKCDLLISTDMYKKNSIKSWETTSRGSGQKPINKGESTKRPENRKSFLSDDSNKKQLVRLLLKVWSSDDFGRKLQNKKVIFTCEEKAYLLKDNGALVIITEIPKLVSDQEETGTRVVLYYFYAADEEYNYV